MKNFLVLILILFVFSSCEDFFETTLELETPEYEEKLVVGAILNNEYPFQRILITKTVGLDQVVFEESNDIGDEVSVNLIYPDGSYYPFNAKDDNNSYNHNFEILDHPQFIPGNEYVLEVTAPGFPVVSSKSKLPQRIPLTNLSYEEDGGFGPFGDEMSAIDFEFQDPPGEKNYYKALIILNANGRRTFGGIDLGIVYSGEYNSVVISDEAFDGEYKKIRLQTYRHWSNDIEHVYLQWNIITEEQFLYDRALRQLRDNDGNPFSSPSQLPFNIDNGIGFFGLENRFTYTVK